jgi:ethanolamine ammonia-lyase small subunit
MAEAGEESLALGEWPEMVRKVRARTPARLLAGRVGAAYRTATLLELREAHAAARDAVWNELDLQSGEAVFIKRFDPLELRTRAQGRQDYLLRPDLGRQFDETSRAQLAAIDSRGIDLQIAIGDGLSTPAVVAQVPALLPLLEAGAGSRGWALGRILVIHHCRVGILNEIGELVKPQVAVLLIGERPGLATADSLSAYLAYRPRVGHSDADRNLISNIHARGWSASEAAEGILSFAAQMRKAEKSGYLLRKQMPAIKDTQP